MGNRVDLLPVDRLGRRRRSVLSFLQPRQRAVVEAAAVAEAVALGVEGQQGPEHHVGLEHRRTSGSGSRMPHMVSASASPGDQALKHERLPLASMTGSARL